MELDALDAYMEQVASHTQSIPEDAAPTNSRCVLLVHVLTPEAAVDVNAVHTARMETGRECERWGRILRVHAVGTVLDADGRPQPSEADGRIFVEFQDASSAMECALAMDGRFFDGRRVSASFYPADAFLAGVFGLQGTEAVAPRSKTITMEEIAAMHAETKPSDAEASSTDLPTANGDGGGGGSGAEHEQAGSDDDFMRQLRARAEEAQRREAKRSQELLEARDDAIDALVEEFPDAADGAAGGGDDDADADPSADRAAAAASKKVLPTVDHSKIDYAPFRKSFYVEAPEIAAMTEDEVAALRKEMDDVKVRGKRCPRPVKRWRQCGLSDRILAAIEKAGYDKPFPIQAQSLPAVMSGRDVIAIAKTGSGKTMGYTLPMVRHAMDQPRLAAGEGPIGLVMVPTRELALQVYREVKKFASVAGLGVASLRDHWLRPCIMYADPVGCPRHSPSSAHHMTLCTQPYVAQAHAHSRPRGPAARVTDRVGKGMLPVHPREPPQTPRWPQRRQTSSSRC